MAEVDDLIVRVRARGHDLWLAGPQPAEAITALEGALSVALLPSYRDFVIHFGGAAIYDSTVSGIIDGQPLDETAGSLYGDTFRFREDYSLPGHLLVVQPDEDAPTAWTLARAARTESSPWCALSYTPSMPVRSRRISGCGFDIGSCGTGQKRTPNKSLQQTAAALRLSAALRPMSGRRC